MPFQVILFLIQIISLFAQFFHSLQMRLHSLPAIRPYLLIFPSQFADCIIVIFYLFQQAYLVYQILYFLIRFIKVCICHNFSTQPHHDFLLHIRHNPINPHFPIGSFQRYISGVYLPVLPVLKPLAVPLSTALVPFRNDAPTAPNQTLSPAIGLWYCSAP